MSEPSQPRDDDRTSGIQVIARAARILNALGNQPDGMSLGEIALAVDLPRSTVQRIVGALDSVQMVRSHGAGGVRLGPALLRLVANVHSDLVTVATPFLEALGKATGETAVLSRTSGTQLAIVHSVIADRELRVVPRIGMNLPLHSTSGGKALLALDDDALVSELLGHEFPAMTPLTIKALPELLRHLAEVRRTGISYDRGETLEGICTIAVAIDTVLGRFAISLLVPGARFSKHEMLYRQEILNCKEALLSEIGKVAAPE